MAKENQIGRQGAIAAAPDDARWLERNDDLTGEQIRQLYDRLRALYTLAEEIHRSNDYDSISQIAIVFFQTLLAPDRVILAIQTSDGRFSVQSCGVEAGNDPASWPVSQNLLQHVRDEHLAVLATDATEHEVLGRFKSIGSLNIRSVLCVPLGTAESPRGLIYLDSQLETGVFDSEDLYFLTTVCRLLDAAIESIDRAVEQTGRTEKALKQIQMLREELFERHRVVGQSTPLLHAYEQLKRVASKTTAPILIRGESGTGKELFARLAHYYSSHHTGAFVETHLAACNPQLIESELFGHVEGAFTGASDRIGKIELADGGTLFLDEVADIPTPIQAKLLRVLEEKTFNRVGSNELIRSDFRLISATSSDIEAMAAKESFRSDLLNRVAGMTIIVPPLRDRPDDIPLLAEYFLQQYFLEQGRVEIPFSETAMQFLQDYSWPGNVRQLSNCVQIAAAFAEGDEIRIRDIEQVLQPSRRSSTINDEHLCNVAELLKETERTHMLKALDQTNSHATQAAKLIGMSKASFSEKRKRYNI